MPQLLTPNPRFKRVHQRWQPDASAVPPGFPRPLIFAMVNLDELRLFTRLVDTDVTVVRRGMTVELSPSAVTSDPGEERYLPTFRAVRGEDTT